MERLLFRATRALKAARCGLLAAALALSAGPALAEAVFVLSSSAKLYREGDKLPLDAQLVLDEGESVRLLMPDASDHLFIGALDAPIRDLPSAQSPFDEIYAAIVDFFTGSRDETALAAFRNEAFVIDGWPLGVVGSQGDPAVFCFDGGAPELRLPTTGETRARRVVVIARNGGRSSEATLEGAAQTLDFPITPTDGAIFTVRLIPGGDAVLQFRRAPRAVADGPDQIRRLYESDCYDQARFAAGLGG